MTLRPEHIEEALNKKTFDEIDPDEVLKHYGYKPEEVHCNGVGIGVWRKEEAFQKLGDIGAFMRFVDHAVPSDLVAEAKYGDKACSAEQLAYRAALDAKKKGHKLLDDTEDDADTSGANSVGGAAPDGVSGTGTKNKNQTDAEKRAMVKNLFHPKKEG